MELRACARAPLLMAVALVSRAEALLPAAYIKASTGTASCRLHVAATRSLNELSMVAYDQQTAYDDDETGYSDSSLSVRMSPSKNTNVSFTEAAGEGAYSIISGVARTLSNVGQSDQERSMPVSLALNRLQRDMTLLDQAAVWDTPRIAGRMKSGISANDLYTACARPRLTPASFFVLSSTVLISFASPLMLSEKLVEVLVPSMSALSAAIGISSEYTGRVEVARGKEIAAVTLQAAAEAEGFLAQAERAKAIVPLCVGVATTFSALALLAPAVAAEVAPFIGVQGITQIYLLCPLFAVLAAAVASLATQESVTLCSRAIGVGARRFASSEGVGRTWMSATEMITRSSTRSKSKWFSFALSVLPAPLFGALFPGPFALKAIVAAASAAAQAAYSLARVEYSLSQAVDSVALKSRCAAVSDTYANQGARAGAILPFTSALSGLCAAVTVAVVELLPLLPSLPLEAATSVLFPGIGALVAAAASVSKARCEVDASAATAAASQVASGSSDDLIELRPFNSVYELVRLLFRPFVERVRALSRRLRWRSLTPAKRLRLAREEIRYRFEKIDLNGDGRLSISELQSVVAGMCKSSSQDRRVLREAAELAASDGSVSFDQFRRIMEMEWRRFGPPANLFGNNKAPYGGS